MRLSPFLHLRRATRFIAHVHETVLFIAANLLREHGQLRQRNGGQRVAARAVNDFAMQTIVRWPDESGLRNEKHNDGTESENDAKSY